MIGSIPGTDVHWGLVFGLVAALASYVLIYHTVFGFAARVPAATSAPPKSSASASATDPDICFLAGGLRALPA
jgi:ABC-type uncharacterized transport system, permease component